MPGSATLNEFEAIPNLSAIFAAAGATARGGKRVEVGIGDDAAVLQPGAGRLVWTVDTAVEHVHFERAWLTLGDLGWRSLNAAASDVCAMAGKPVCALSSVIFPRGFSAPELRRLARGQRDAARALGCRVVGGNLSRGAELSITTTVIGSVARPLLRSGAEPGDELWLLGEIGLAAAGLGLLKRGRTPKSAAERRALRAFRRPQAQLGFGLALSRRAHSAIDLSDGLAGDAAHLARASDVSLVIDAGLLLAATHSAVHSLAPELGVSALNLALYGGEDYALLATGPTRARPEGARRIGLVEKGRGLWLCTSAQPAGASHRVGRTREAIDTQKAYQHRAISSAAR